MTPDNVDVGVTCEINTIPQWARVINYVFSYEKCFEQTDVEHQKVHQIGM